MTSTHVLADACDARPPNSLPRHLQHLLSRQVTSSPCSHGQPLGRVKGNSKIGTRENDCTTPA
eukprot:1145854-Amphidinium_carterae.1